MVAWYYTCVFSAVLCLTLGRIGFEVWCPSFIKLHPNEEAYLNSVKGVGTEFDVRRLEMSVDWEQADIQPDHRIWPTAGFFTSLGLLTAAFLLGIAALNLFARR